MQQRACADCCSACGGCPLAVSDQLPPGAEALAEPPLQEASVGWGIWLFYNKEDDAPAGEQQEEGEQQEQDEQQQEQQQQESEAEEAEQPQEPTPGTWWRGMVWWFSQKEAKYKVRVTCT